MIHIEGGQFKDDSGRVLMLRGVNLGGSSKVPYTPNGATYNREGFFDHRNVSFVGRPFPLEEADEHFRRLHEWGLTFLRLLITWEAIEHAGPGIYDEAYLDYLRALAVKAGEYGINLFIDPHEDVWSRFSGGDGAPGWTLEAVGLDMTRFAETGAAIVHAVHGDPFPRMVWITNGGKLAAATLFTLFFGGNDFAPQTKVACEPVQEYLQRHYLQAIVKVVERLKGLDNVLGYDTLNEPLSGYIGWKDLSVCNGMTTLGEAPTPFQTMALGDGYAQDVGVWDMGLTGFKRTGTRRINAGGVRAWRDGCGCIWREHGVWDVDAASQPRLLKPDYFTHANGREIEFAQDYYYPFARRFTQVVRAVDPGAMIFVESEPSTKPPRWEPEYHKNLVFAPHWYDGMVLLTKSFKTWLAVDIRDRKPVWLAGNIRKSFADQLAFLKRGSAERLGGAPVVLAEFGVPYDMDNKKAYRTGDFSAQIQALDRTYQAVEANLLHTTQWNYTSDNSNARGDQWNDEDLSIFSRDQQTNPADINSGGRALEAVVRPYPITTAGEPLRLSFDLKRRAFEYTFKHDPKAVAPTEIFLPRLQYPGGCHVQVSDGRCEIQAENQRLLYWHTEGQADHTIRIVPG